MVEEKLFEYAKYVKKLVDEFILDTVKGEPQIIYDAALHYIKAGGKRLRPLITVLSAKIFGCDERVAIPGAAAVEVLHTFTLIHDDIMDRDEMRRGVPTVHKLWGEDIAIVAGDLLYAFAYKCLLRGLELGIPKDRILKSVEYLTDATIAIAEGQALDLVMARNRKATVEDYIKMVEGKTAALFMASASIGATLAGADEEQIELLREIFRYAGIAFQIQDDILGLLGDEKLLGKPVLSDLREGKMTILLIYTLNNVDANTKDLILSIVGNRNASIEDLKQVARIITDVGAVEYATRIANEFTDKALKLFDRIECRDKEACELLKEVITYLVKRKY